MAIITISRELAALGDETARELANQLQCRFVNKLTLEERIKSYGVSNAKMSKYDEKKPSFWASLSKDRDDYLHFLKSAVLDEACEENSSGHEAVVFIGRGASVILKSVPGVFSVYLVAPLEIRIERVKSYFHCDEKRARDIIEQCDNDRKGFHRYFFDVNWQDAGNYHLTLNTGHLHPELCAEIVKYMRDRVMKPDMEEQGIQRLHELRLAQQVLYRVLYDKQVPVHFLEASVSGKVINLYGVASSQTAIEAAITYTKEMAAEYSVHSEIQIVQEYTVMP